MSDVAIRVEGLGKCYRIGALQKRHDTLRDLIASKFKGSAGDGRLETASGSSDIIWALKDVSFEVKRGEVIGIIGRNGAGKSTLLKILSRITEPTEGTADIYGRVASLLEVGTGFHPELTGRENIFLNGAILGMRKAEIVRKFDEIVAFAEIEKFIDTPVKHYSSGMYVRLAFAVAAHLEPEILLVDEVLAVGDAEFQKKCLGKMGDVAREGRTVLFVSHNMAAVEQLCTRAILISEGRLKNLGNVKDVIGLYLSGDGFREKNEENILAHSANGLVHLVSIGPIDEQGRPLSIVQCGRDLYLRIELRTTIPLPRMTVSIGINNLHEVRITVLHSGTTGYQLSLDSGIRSVICQVPNFPLSAGSYVMDVKVLSGHEVVLWAPHIEQLMVEAGDFYNTGKLPDVSWGGMCYLQQRWEVQGE